MRITAELNNAYHEPEKVRALFSRLIGKDVDESFFMFPPFCTDFGKNITIGAFPKPPCSKEKMLKRPQSGEAGNGGE
jgi:hypothetical protein